MKLMPYDFSIIDKARKENKGADVLSHRPHLADFLALALPFSSDLTDLQEALKIDPYTRDIMQALACDPSSFPVFLWPVKSFTTKIDL